MLSPLSRMLNKKKETQVFFLWSVANVGGDHTNVLFKGWETEVEENVDSDVAHVAHLSSQHVGWPQRSITPADTMWRGSRKKMQLYVFVCCCAKQHLFCER